MVQVLIFFWIVTLGSVFAQAEQRLACTDLAKLTCTKKTSVQAEKNYNDYLEKVKGRYLDALEEGRKKYPLNVFFKKTGIARPPVCVGTVASSACVEALRKEMSQTAIEVSNYLLGKPSKYSDPNVPRTEILFSLYEGISLETTKEFMAKKKSQLKRVEARFKDVKAAMIENIKSQLQDPDRAAVLERVSAIQFDGDLCTSGNFPAEVFLVASAMYEKKPNTFTACPRILLSDMTDTQISFMIGHELSHSFDPCRAVESVGSAEKKLFKPLFKYSKTKNSDQESLARHPYSEQLKCLRGARSAGAQNAPLTEAELQELKRQKMSPSHYQLCGNDQINESFADWMGIEAAVASLSEVQKKMSLPQLEAEYASVYSTKCNDVEPGFDVHPSVEKRANGILAAKPEVRRLLQCEKTELRSIYCAPPQQAQLNRNEKREKAGAIR